MANGFYLEGVGFGILIHLSPVSAEACQSSLYIINNMITMLRYKSNKTMVVIMAIGSWLLLHLERKIIIFIYLFFGLKNKTTRQKDFRRSVPNIISYHHLILYITDVDEDYSFKLWGW